MEQKARILRSLLTQLERQEALDEEAPNGIAGEFARLKSQSIKYRTDKTYPTKTAEKQENIKKNRYKDIVPFDHSRVKLTLTPTKNGTDYINASFIKGVSGSRAYIATQGPLPHTLVDFLRMLWEYNVMVVVMACREFEMGKKKCELYWPQKQEKSFVCEPFTIYCDSEENKGDYVTRTLRVTYQNCSRTLKQLHYVNWPDHGVPDTIQPILDMLHEMRTYQAHDDIPICIHCSAGCGRTGVLCVIDYTWNLLMKEMITSDFSIYDLVQNMRTQRPSVVQTKEQYDLVYRTIRLLFQRYLKSMDAHACQNEVTAVPSDITPAIAERELFNLSEDFDLMPQFQHLLDEERDLSQQHHTPLPPASEDLIPLRAKTMPSDQQQWQLLQTLPEALATTPDMHEGPRTQPEQVYTSQSASAVKERTKESDDVPSLNPPPSPSVAAAICLLVEDPYFDTPMSSPSSEEPPMNPNEDMEQWTCSPVLSAPSLFLNDETLDSHASGPVEIHTDEEEPPPLPERTPESYVLAKDAELAEPCERLSVIIPPNAAAEAVRELQGSPHSPAPPLPERTPESYELATDQAKQTLQVMPAVNLNRIGVSSEWSGNSKPAATEFQNEAKTFVRSKSLRAKMTFTAPAPVTHLDLTSNMASNFRPYCPPPDPLPPPQFSQTEDNLTPPLPDRTPESFILTTEEIHEKTSPCSQHLQTTHPSMRIGMSSEWDGTSQPKNLFDAVMCRSKSVRAKSSRQEPLTAVQPLAPLPVVVTGGGSEPLTAVQPLAPLPVVVTGGGSAQVEQHDGNHRPSLNTERSGNILHKSNEKGVSRTKSLKFFRHKHKPKTAPPSPPTQPRALSQSDSASFSVFKFGFGNRFRKPKGPRNYPETWV